MNESHAVETFKPRFALGRLVITQGAVLALKREDVKTALARHLAGDWGDVDDHDKAENDLSLVQGFRLLSAYKTQAGVRFWVITESDRSVTTILLPEEY
jgi:hypothetical protein